MSVDQGVRELIIEILSVQPEEIKMDEKLSDSLGVDSTEMVNVILALEKKFDLHIEDKQITKFSSLRDIITLIESKRAAA
ncbi:MAG: acyl carrier protein [Deltaproteobacteria bacterium]|jgi:acyl carrier protein|nr:acyl carrier protein [Deltaproteobacteria bacterium]